MEASGILFRCADRFQVRKQPFQHRPYFIVLTRFTVIAEEVHANFCFPVFCIIQGVGQEKLQVNGFCFQMMTGTKQGACNRKLKVLVVFGVCAEFSSGKRNRT